MAAQRPRSSSAVLPRTRVEQPPWLIMAAEGEALDRGRCDPITAILRRPIRVAGDTARPSASLESRGPRGHRYIAVHA